MSNNSINYYEDEESKEDNDVSNPNEGVTTFTNLIMSSERSDMITDELLTRTIRPRSIITLPPPITLTRQTAISTDMCDDDDSLPDLVDDFYDVPPMIPITPQLTLPRINTRTSANPDYDTIWLLTTSYVPRPYRPRRNAIVMDHRPIIEEKVNE